MHGADCRRLDFVLAGNVCAMPEVWLSSGGRVRWMMYWYGVYADIRCLSSVIRYIPTQKFTRVDGVWHAGFSGVRVLHGCKWWWC